MIKLKTAKPLMVWLFLCFNHGVLTSRRLPNGQFVGTYRYFEYTPPDKLG